MIEVYFQKDAKLFSQNMKYWCNACGELHHHGEYEIEEKDLPDELLRAYQELWTDGTGSYCYLCEYKGAYYVSLVNEFWDDEDAGEPSKTREYFNKALNSGRRLSAVLKEPVIVAEPNVDTIHAAVIVLVPAETSKKRFLRIGQLLYEHAYEDSDADILWQGSISAEDVGEQCYDEFGKPVILGTKETLIERIKGLHVNESFDWNEIEQESGRVLASYCVKKIEWSDSTLVLIGGYGGDTLSSYLPGESCNSSEEPEDEANIRSMVEKFFDVRNIGDEFIFMSVPEKAAKEA